MQNISSEEIFLLTYITQNIFVLFSESLMLMQYYL